VATLAAVVSVGIRDLKNRLSEYLRRVRLGESMSITDRGQVVAELLPPGQGHTDPSASVELLALARRGIVSLGTPGTPIEQDLYPALPRARRTRRRSAGQLLDEERGPR